MFEPRFVWENIIDISGVILLKSVILFFNFENSKTKIPETALSREKKSKFHLIRFSTRGVKLR